MGRGQGNRNDIKIYPLELYHNCFYIPNCLALIHLTPFQFSIVIGRQNSVLQYKPEVLWCFIPGAHRWIHIKFDPWISWMNSHHSPLKKWFILKSTSLSSSSTTFDPFFCTRYVRNENKLIEKDLMTRHWLFFLFFSKSTKRNKNEKKDTNHERAIRKKHSKDRYNLI